MYMQNDIVAAAAPVFHIDPPRIDAAERRAEIDRVIELATAAIPKAQMKKLGRLSLAPARDDDDHSYFAQIRSEVIGASGLEFRFPMAARDTGERNLDDTAAELAEVAVIATRIAAKLKKPVKLLRGIADQALRPATGGIAGASLTAIGITPADADEKIKITMDVAMLGDDLTMNIERTCEHLLGGGLNRLEAKLKEFAAKHVARRTALAQVKVAGASGWIDDSALRILDRAVLDRAVALGMLRRDRQIDFSFGGETGYDLMGGVYWDDGVVRGYVENRARGNTFRLEAKVLTIQTHRLPATILADLTGRSLGEVLETDYIPGDALIVETEESGDWLHLRLEIGRSLIESAVDG